MQLRRQELLFRHRIQIAIETVHDDQFCRFARSIAPFRRATNNGGEFSGGEFGWIDLLHSNQAAFEAIIHWKAQFTRSRTQRADVLVEYKKSHAFATGSGGGSELCGNGRFAGAGRTQQKSAGARGQPSAEQSVKLRVAAREATVGKFAKMLGRDQAGKNVEPTAADGEIVIPAAK